MLYGSLSIRTRKPQAFAEICGVKMIVDFPSSVPSNLGDEVVEEVVVEYDRRPGFCRKCSSTGHPSSL